MSLAGLVESALFWNVDRVLFEGHERLLTADGRNALNQALRVGLHPLISEILSVDGGIAVNFKRFLKPRLLHARAKPILNAMQNTPTVAELSEKFVELGDPDNVLELVRQFEVLRIAHVTLDHRAVM